MQANRSATKRKCGICVHVSVCDDSQQIDRASGHVAGGCETMADFPDRPGTHDDQQIFAVAVGIEKGDDVVEVRHGQREHAALLQRINQVGRTDRPAAERRRSPVRHAVWVDGALRGPEASHRFLWGDDRNRSPHRPQQVCRDIASADPAPRTPRWPARSAARVRPADLPARTPPPRCRPYARRARAAGIRR